ncbi:MAG: S1 RNA-binding domain-containing protein, partial [Planctomycetota bacterium]
MKRMLINAIDPEESRIAVVEDGVLQELHVELANREAYLGNIYKGKVVNIEPSIGAAFVAFGGRVNGFLHVSDVLPAYGRDDFQLEDVIEGRARVDADDGPESMQQALSDDDDDDDGDGDGGVEPSRGDVDHEESNVALAEHDEAEAEPVDPEAVADEDDDADDDARADDASRPEPDDEPFADDAADREVDG